MTKHLTLLLFIGIYLTNCEDQAENNCTDVMALVKGYSRDYNTNDSCQIIEKPFMKEIDIYTDTNEPTRYNTLTNNTFYTYQRWTSDDSTKQPWYTINSSFNIYESYYYSTYFVGETLFIYRNQDTCYSEYQTNLEIRYPPDSLVWCPPSTSEPPEYDTLFYACSDYPTAYVPQCWDIDNPF